jgi:hypothetical protein
MVRIAISSHPILRFAGLRFAAPGYAQNDAQFKRRSSVHEQVPNTNIKIICPEVGEKLLYAEPGRFMNFPPTPTSTYFRISFQ